MSFSERILNRHPNAGFGGGGNSPMDAPFAGPVNDRTKSPDRILADARGNAREAFRIFTTNPVDTVRLHGRYALRTAQAYVATGMDPASPISFVDDAIHSLRAAARGEDLQAMLAGKAVLYAQRGEGRLTFLTAAEAVLADSSGTMPITEMYVDIAEKTKRQDIFIPVERILTPVSLENGNFDTLCRLAAAADRLNIPSQRDELLMRARGMLSQSENTAMRHLNRLYSAHMAVGDLPHAGEILSDMRNRIPPPIKDTSMLPKEDQAREKRRELQRLSLTVESIRLRAMAGDDTAQEISRMEEVVSFYYPTFLTEGVRSVPYIPLAVDFAEMYAKLAEAQHAVGADSQPLFQEAVFTACSIAADDDKSAYGIDALMDIAARQNNVGASTDATFSFALMRVPQTPAPVTSTQLLGLEKIGDTAAETGNFDAANAVLGKFSEMATIQDPLFREKIRLLTHLAEARVKQLPPGFLDSAA